MGKVWEGVAKDEVDSSTVQLHDGTSIPVIGYGTYKVGVIPSSSTGAADLPTPRDASPVLTEAVAAGYRMFDCAQFYENEHILGPILKNSGIPRGELYLISKVWGSTIAQGRDAVRAQVLKTINDLQCEYLDMYMIHWPVPGKHVEAYKELLSLKVEGKIKSVAVSNYTIEDIQELQAVEPKLTLPTVNQIEINPWMYRKNTIQFMRDNNIVMMSYRGLNNGKAQDTPVIQDLCKKYGKTPAQILGRWLLQEGCIHIPKSENSERMKENKDLFSFHMDDADVKALESLTTEESYKRFETTHKKGIVRDTDIPLPESFKCTTD